MMNSVQRDLLELVQMAETPLYSAFRWLSGRFDNQLSLERFLEMIGELVEDDVLRLWEVDSESFDRTELYEVPKGLPGKYASVQHDDRAFDPFGLSLSLGEKAAVESSPEWEFDCDFAKGRFLLRSFPAKIEEALNELKEYFPEVSFLPRDERQENERVVIIGTLQPS